MIERMASLGRLAKSLAIVLAVASAAGAAYGSSALELVRIAHAHEQANQDDLAVRRYMEALSLDPTCEEAYLGLKRQGILVRYFDKPGLRDKLRITIGTSQENNALIGGIKNLGATEKAA